MPAARDQEILYYLAESAQQKHRPSAAPLRDEGILTGPAPPVPDPTRPRYDDDDSPSFRHQRIYARSIQHVFLCVFYSMLRQLLSPITARTPQLSSHSSFQLQRDIEHGTLLRSSATRARKQLARSSGCRRSATSGNGAKCHALPTRLAGVAHRHE